tara:strand:- start:610 stop:807 length:198 start_codon:yes stop_codon:yes gene_type:complete
MKSKEEIISCFNDELKWRDTLEDGKNRFDTFEKFIHQGWCEALEWVLHEIEPTTADEYNKVEKKE